MRELAAISGSMYHPGSPMNNQVLAACSTLAQAIEAAATVRGVSTSTYFVASPSITASSRRTYVRALRVAAQPEAATSIEHMVTNPVAYNPESMFHAVATRVHTVAMESIISTERAVQQAVYELCLALYGNYSPSEGGF
jgi:hypothetical protein